MAKKKAKTKRPPLLLTGTEARLIRTLYRAAVGGSGPERQVLEALDRRLGRAGIPATAYDLFLVGHVELSKIEKGRTR